MAEVVRILGVDDVAMIAEAIQYRQNRFIETFVMSVGVVLMNYGEKHVNVVCVQGEFLGTKGDLDPREGIPLCPNGHPLFETSTGPKLALINEEINNA